MAFVKDPLLIVWEAMNLLVEVDAYPDMAQISRLLLDAELSLFQVAIELAQRANLDNRTARPDNIVFIDRRSRQ